MWAERERRKSRSALQPISVTPAPRSFPAPRPPAPRASPLHRFSATLAHRSAPPDFRPAPFSAPLTLRSPLLVILAVLSHRKNSDDRRTCYKGRRPEPICVTTECVLRCAHRTGACSTSGERRSSATVMPQVQEIITRNSSGDEIANVNFLYDDIVHAVKIQ